MVTREQIVQWLQAYADVIEQNKQYLTQLDAAIGDADHGTNMDRGFKKVMAQLPTLADKDIGNILKSTGMALISSVGGASGPLYGTFFMRAGMAVDKKHELTGEDVGELLQAGLDGVRQRGRAELGDKTMVDAIAPAVEAYKGALEGDADISTALDQAATAAEQGMTDTIPMVAKKGRASYLGGRSAGHQDPGATSSYLLLRTLADVVTGK
ncbi:MAG: dihydroxyacetone kinase subunit DhaL [Chloroflexota bacterium]|nr:dihydroxyacetone kinase subunit DhaL [Chloroflexota bacterium]